MGGAAEYEIALTPHSAATDDLPTEAPAVRRERVTATGELGTSGYPRFAGQGVVADISEETATVEAITVDGGKLPLGWTASVIGTESQQHS